MTRMFEITCQAADQVSKAFGEMRGKLLKLIQKVIGGGRDAVREADVRREFAKGGIIPNRDRVGM